MLNTPALSPAATADPARPPAVALDALSLTLGGTPILQNVSLRLDPGRVLALLGPSGCGKTTILRLVAGLMAPDEGEIWLAGQRVAGRGRMLPPEARGLGMVFQDYALWPHMSVAANVAFPLEMARVGRAEREARALAALERVGLRGLADRRPAQLSGGQQQRVAIARAIVAEPPLVLFDEPLSNLDRELRETMVDEIAGLVADLGLTALYVTHDHAEAFSLADEVAVLRAGRVEQVDAPEALVDRPANADVAAFLRLGALLPVTRDADGWRLAGGARIAPPGAAPEGSARVLIPSRALHLATPAEATLTARVERSLFRGDGHVLSLSLDGGHALLHAHPARIAAGTSVGLRFHPEDLRWFPA